MKLTNLTPHSLNLFDASGENQVATVAPSGNAARISTNNTLDGEVDGVPIFRQVTGELTGLPEPKEGVGYVVSMAVRLAVPDRKDVFSPGELVRNEGGQPVGCKGLVSN